MKENRIGLLWLLGVVLFFMFVGPLWDLIIDGLNGWAVSPSVRAELKGSVLELSVGFLVFATLLAVQLRVLGIAYYLQSLAMALVPLFAMLGVTVSSAILWWLNLAGNYFVPAPIFVLLTIILDGAILYVCVLSVHRRALGWVASKPCEMCRQGVDWGNLRIFVASIWVNAAAIAFTLRLVVAEFSFNNPGS